MSENRELPGPADVDYFTQAQAGGWGEMLRGFARFLALPPGWRVLDVGAGPGLLPRLLAGAGARLAVGCDDSPAMLRRAAALTAGQTDDSGAPGERTGVAPAWVLADGVRLPFAAGAFDATVATNLLFLLRDPAAGIAALVRVTRPGGVVAFVNPSEGMSAAAAETLAAQRGLEGFARFSFVNYGRLAEAHHRLSAAQWSALAESAGLTDVRAEMRAGGLVVFVRGMMGRGDTETRGRGDAGTVFVQVRSEW